MKSDSWRAMLPGVLASHSQYGSNDMGIVAASGATLDNTVPSAKSTTRPRPVGRLKHWVALALFGVTLSAAAGAQVAAQQAGGSSIAPKVSQTPVGTLSDLMIRIIYPASDAIFYVTTRTPSSDAEWAILQGQALMVAESANLLMMPAHMRDEDRWLADARLMRDAGAAAFKAAKAKDVKALDELNEAMYESCVTCHVHYRPSYGRGR
jgi:hypothetical protein